MSERPTIPLVELVRHYREFKSKRDATGRRGPYRTQAARKKLAERYLADPDELAGKVRRSAEAFSLYANVGESFIGTTRGEPAEVAGIDEIVNGPTAAAYLDRVLPKRRLTIADLGHYIYVDREVRPARTTAGPHATMANRFEDGTRSTTAISADLLLRSGPEGRPTIGEVKVSTGTGDDADPVYALVQALALAVQLAGSRQRERLHRWYPDAGFADDGPLDVLILLFRPVQRGRLRGRG